jgi:hypothetical protein
MQEKIAGEIYEGITGLPWPPDDAETRYTKEKCMKHADAILSLPVEGFDCTLGELPERARKMREALKFYSHAIAVIQVESCPTNTKDNPYKERRIDTPHPNVADDALTFKDK